MAFHILPLLPKIIGWGYVGAKLCYLIPKAHKLGWDPKKIGLALAEDLWAVLGASRRGITAGEALYAAYNAKDIPSAVAACRTLHRLNAELQQDASLAERHLDRLIDINARIDVVMRIAFTSAGFAMSMRDCGEFEAANEHLVRLFFGLYLYGRNGHQFSSEELGRVQGQLCSALENMTRTDTESPVFVKKLLSLFQTYLPEKAPDIEYLMDQLPEWQQVKQRCGDPRAMTCFLYSLKADGAGKPQPVAGTMLFRQFDTAPPHAS